MRDRGRDRERGLPLGASTYAAPTVRIGAAAVSNE